MYRSVLFLFTLTTLVGCQFNVPNKQKEFVDLKPSANSTYKPYIKHEKYTLDNGLQVILHVDKSDPIVAVNLSVNVGSAREVPGKTGLAHLFEHLLFLNSENVGFGGLDKLSTRIGGSGNNGFTSTHNTQYFQSAPSDALEKLIWAEADKIGYFINTVNENTLAVERQVVKNEKRQNVDERAYGETNDVIGKLLYPKGHPYSWQVIGSLEDLEAATLKDVKDFYNAWYVPNNTTFTVAGNFDPKHVKTLINKYFGEIPKGAEIPEWPNLADVKIKNNIRVYHEDRLASAPQLNMVWAGVTFDHPDSQALRMLTTFLSYGKEGLLQSELIEAKKLTTNVGIYSMSNLLAGEINLTVDAKAGNDLDAILPAINKVFDKFEQQGIRHIDIQRIIERERIELFTGIESVATKASNLGGDNSIFGDPNFTIKNFERLETVTPEDVMRVYKKYIKGQNFISTSFVPLNQVNLALEHSTKVDVYEEDISIETVTPISNNSVNKNIVRTASSFDRTKEPDFGQPYTLPALDIWQNTLSNGINVSGIETHEVPTVYFSLEIDAGIAYADPKFPSIPSIAATLLSKGTAFKTPAQLEHALDELGARIGVSAGGKTVKIEGYSYTKNFEKTVALIEEVLLHPRWDNEELSLIIDRRLDDMAYDENDPNSISRKAFNKIYYPDGHIYKARTLETQQQIKAININQLKAFYQTHYRPDNAKLNIVGSVKSNRVQAAFSSLAQQWTTDIVRAQTKVAPALPIDKSSIYFYPMPDAKQSIIRLSNPSISITHPDYNKVKAVNFLLGGAFTSILNQELRVKKGYTYSIGSYFGGNTDMGNFSLSTSVRSNATYDSLLTIKNILENYGEQFNEDDLKLMKSSLTRGQALRTESLSAKLYFITSVVNFGYSPNYLAEDAAEIEAMTLKEFKRIVKKYIQPEAMLWFVLGDISQAEKLSELGYGKPIILASAKNNKSTSK